MLPAIYNLFIRLYAAGIHVAASWNPKARQWVTGRQKQRAGGTTFCSGSEQVVWMHCASLGEFEQGRPLLERLRRDYPVACIVVTFFSPSGYEVMKQYPAADHVLYLPLPTAGRAREFITLLRPTLVLWIKYDYWHAYLAELRRRRVPVLLVSAVFTRQQPFFRWYGGLHRRTLACFTGIFVQTAVSARLLEEIDVRGNVYVNGDTRFDRVSEVAAQPASFSAIERFIHGRQVIIAGSTWPADEELLSNFASVNSSVCFIVAPHETDEAHLGSLERLYPSAVRLSALPADAAGPGTYTEVRTLLIDNVGMLSRLYRYATICYVGGGFGHDGVHNVLEAAVYGKPVVFGPVFNKYQEAIDLVEEGGAFTVDSPAALEKAFSRLLLDTGFYRQSAGAAHRYVMAHQGATENILRYIQEKRLLTSI